MKKLLSILFGIAIVFSVTNVAHASGGLVGYWKLDETSGTSAADSTGYGNTGTYVGSPTLNVAPPSALTFPSRAVTFNGISKYVNVGNISPATAFSVSVWAKATSLASNTTIVGRATASNLVQGWGLIWDSGSQTMRFWINGYGTNYAYKSFNDTTSWHHFISVWTGTTLQIYIDGVKGTDASYATAPIYSTDTMVIGKANLSYAGWNWVGSIDDVRIYNVALSAGEISTIASGALGRMTNLAGWWKLDTAPQSMIKGSASAYSRIQ